MSAVLEMRGIRVAQAARNALWTVAIRARLREGPATSHELSTWCGAEKRGPFAALINRLKVAGEIECTEVRHDARGIACYVWALTTVEMQRAA